MRTKKIILAVLLTLVFWLAASGAPLAMSSSSYNLPWTVLSGGGVGRSSSGYVLGDTIGQPSAIGESHYRLGGGYSYGVGGAVNHAPVANMDTPPMRE